MGMPASALTLLRTMTRNDPTDYGRPPADHIDRADPVMQYRRKQRKDRRQYQVGSKVDLGASYRLELVWHRTTKTASGIGSVKYSPKYVNISWFQDTASRLPGLAGYA